MGSFAKLLFKKGCPKIQGWTDQGSGFRLNPSLMKDLKVAGTHSADKFTAASLKKKAGNQPCYAQCDTRT